MKIDSKQQRLADALKKNLLKRKQQKQERQEDAKSAESLPEHEFAKVSIQKLGDPLAKL